MYSCGWFMLINSRNQHNTKQISSNKIFFNYNIMDTQQTVHIQNIK